MLEKKKVMNDFTLLIQNAIVPYLVQHFSNVKN
jgi:hypothetical protein